ncbi:RNA-binding protein PNO1 [Larimichthys crocea]|uniref:Uncharacterized protein n=1 Tax=Larimichthys crocea TaxID=215358 RepID=A0ACD3QBV7_LARCR|nr:RNA-binding protein PNO1 [Larimichthys crocea]
MDADNNTDGTTPESKADTETFTKVKCKKTQKRKREQDAGDMDTEGEPVASKRPQFPPISGDKLKGPDEMRKVAVPGSQIHTAEGQLAEDFHPDRREPTASSSIQPQD